VTISAFGEFSGLARNGPIILQRSFRAKIIDELIGPRPS